MAPRIKKSTSQHKLIKEYELRSSVTSIIDHVKSQVKTTIVEASNTNIINSLTNDDLETLCNIIDSTITQAYVQASASELGSLYKRILGH